MALVSHIACQLATHGKSWLGDSRAWLQGWLSKTQSPRLVAELDGAICSLSMNPLAAFNLHMAFASVRTHPKRAVRHGAIRPNYAPAERTTHVTSRLILKEGGLADT